MRMIELALAVAAGLDGGAHLVARGLLGLGRDGVLQVEDQRVGGNAILAFSSARALEPGM